MPHESLQLTIRERFEHHFVCGAIQSPNGDMDLGSREA